MYKTAYLNSNIYHHLSKHLTYIDYLERMVNHNILIELNLQNVDKSLTK